MNALRKVVKDLEERFRSAQNVFDATVEKLENGSNKKSEQLEKELMKLQNQLDEKDSIIREGGEWRGKHDQLMLPMKRCDRSSKKGNKDGFAKGKHEAEGDFEMRLGRLRAELKGEHEDAMAKPSEAAPEREGRGPKTAGAAAYGRIGGIVEEREARRRARCAAREGP